jgi:LAO/AO transport system kinase
LEIQDITSDLAQETRVDHIGIAVLQIGKTRMFYEAIGLRIGHTETIEQEQVRVAMLEGGEARIELLEATSSESTIAKFVAKRGEGLHHVAIKTVNIDELFERLTSQGVRLASASIQAGAGGRRYFFIHPSSTGGVLVEIVE